jgi:hypothetical protein
VSLTRDGRLTLAPAVSTLYSDGQSVVWSAAQASDGTIYFGTGHKGSIAKLDPAGKTSIIWSAPEPEVFAVAVDARGAVYAATSPDGKVYKIENGKASEYFNPKEKYIWSLAISPKSGTVFVGTGENGKIYQVTAPGQGEVYFDSGQAHITALLLEGSGSLLAGAIQTEFSTGFLEKTKALWCTIPRCQRFAPSPMVRAVCMWLPWAAPSRSELLRLRPPEREPASWLLHRQQRLRSRRKRASTSNLRPKLRSLSLLLQCHRPLQQ